ncbi:MAG: type II secretion system ATPase GspE [Betaproteobacteria bacterium]|nr:type II secretion system ATPase GspE [Betaproteobacteria bacterium]
MAGPEGASARTVEQAAGSGEQPIEPDAQPAGLGEQPAGAIEATAPAARRRIGEILVERGKLDPLALERTLRLQESNVAAGGKRERLGELLVTLGLVAQREVTEALAQQLGLRVIESGAYPEFPILEERVSARFLRQSRALPIKEDEHELVLAMADPTDQFTIDAFAMVTGRAIRPMLALPNELEAAMERLYGANKSALGQIVDGVETRVVDEDGMFADIQQLKDLASEAPVIRLVSLIITNALEQRASDIHIEPFDERLIVRYRIDGVLHEVESPPKRMSAPVISRVKIMASLDIAERRLPQDGRIRLRIQGKEIDLRVSTVPTMHGESVVMRILDKGGVALDWERLGFDADQREVFNKLLAEPNGVLLVTGPTGSGKTTTLYTALDSLNKPDVKILTVEDPVEYQMSGVNQIQVKPQIDLTFANALRSIVRQDPDIIMIGEIRDLETAQIAVQSALTGHLVLSTLHTNDAPSSLNRLLDMGVEDYLLTSTVVGVEAQRLLRTLCTLCREAYEPLPEMVAQMGLQKYAQGGQLTLYHARGCEHCSHTGYIGRMCIMEIMPMTDRIRSLVMRHATATELRAAAIEQGMMTMYDHGLRKVSQGITTLEEVLRVTRDD